MFVQDDSLKKQPNETSNEHFKRLAELSAFAKDSRNNAKDEQEYQKYHNLLSNINEIVLKNEKLSRYVLSFLKSTYPTYYDDYEKRKVIINCAYEEFLKNFSLYNGEFDITTFAKRHLLHGAQKFIADISNKGSYDTELYNKVPF